MAKGARVMTVNLSGEPTRLKQISRTEAGLPEMSIDYVLKQ